MSGQNANEPNFQIHKIYVKDLSFSIPTSPREIGKNWSPELSVDLHTESRALAEKDTHDVVLIIKCRVKSGEHVAFEAEVHQAGIFTIHNISGDPLQHALGAYCPSILYPYAREAIADLVTRGGFPQLNLAPINFDLMYTEQQKQKKQ